MECYREDIPVYPDRLHYFKVYAAHILGDDPRFGLRRRFLSAYKEYEDGITSYWFDFPDGLYEIGILQFDRRTQERISRNRSWLLVFNGEVYAFDYEEMNMQYALYTVFNLNLQIDSD